MAFMNMVMGGSPNLPGGGAGMAGMPGMVGVVLTLQAAVVALKSGHGWQ